MIIPKIFKHKRKRYQIIHYTSGGRMQYGLPRLHEVKTYFIGGLPYSTVYIPTPSVKPPKDATK